MPEKTLSELLATLITRMDLVGDFKTQFALLTSQVAILSDNLGKLNIVVMGNGKPGHHDRIRDLEEDVKDLLDWQTEWKQERTEQRKEMRNIRNTLVISVLMLIISTLVNIFIK